MNIYVLQLHEFVKPVTALAPVVPDGSTARRISLRHAARVAILISTQNTTGVVGAAISLMQAKNPDNDPDEEKVLDFDKVFVCLDAEADDALVEYAVVDFSFVTDQTSNKQALYLIELDASDLDVTNDYSCLRLVVGDTTNQTVAATYFLYPAIGQDAEATAIA